MRQRALTQKPKANTLWDGGAHERLDPRRRRQQLAQHDRSRHANALRGQVKLRDGVLAQRDERDPTEVGHTGVLEHHRGQILRTVARDAIEANAASPGQQCYEKLREGLGRRDQRGGLPQSVRFLVSGP